MSLMALAFLVSALINLLVIRSVSSSERLFVETGFGKPQRFHLRHAPRAGGIGVFAAMASVAGLGLYREPASVGPFAALLACAIPAFAAGLAEDLTHRVRVRDRLFFTALSASLAAWLLDAMILRTDLPGVDSLIVYLPFAAALTLFAVTGVSNSVNIIDGFNGLASMCCLLISAAIGYVAFQVGDGVILNASLVLVGAILGFFVWNYPAGLIFLGDCGAYLLGFLVAELSVLLLCRHPEVSPLFPLLLCAYPIFETVFTMYRRKVVRGVATATPDGIHLHTLIHRRLVRWNSGTTAAHRQMARNSMTSPYLWVVCLASIIPSLLWWNNSRVMGSCIVLFMAAYMLLYRSIVRFKTPKWLLFRR